MPCNVESLASQMGLHEIEIASRKSLFGLTPEVFKDLALGKAILETLVDQLVETFYENQLANPDIALIIGDQETLRRLKHYQREYMLSLVGGDYGKQYVENRLRIGQVHKRLSVEPKHYMSSIHILRNLIITMVDKHLDERKMSPFVSALDRLIAFDISLVFETYTLSLTNDIRSSRDKLAAYAESLEKIVEERTAELEAASLTDLLTGLPNRRALQKEFKRILSSARRHDSSISIAYIDVDNFKGLNDRHGHDKGDFLLKEIGSLLSTCVREEDIASRVGGDEFVVVLSHCDQDSAATFSKRIVDGWNEFVDEYPDNSLSVGTYTCSVDSLTNEEDCFKYADQAMYEAKKKKGNAVFAFEEKTELQ